MPKLTEWLGSMIPAKNGYFVVQPCFEIILWVPKVQKKSSQMFLPYKAPGKSFLRINGDRICK